MNPKNGKKNGFIFQQLSCIMRAEKNSNSGVKGFVFSIDGLIALLILATLILISYTFLANLNFDEINRQELKNFGENTLAILEKNKDLEFTIRADNTQHIKSFINRAPYTTCISLNIYAISDLNNTVVSVSREGCTNVNQNKTTLFRTFYSGNTANMSLYLAELNLWKRNQ